MKYADITTKDAAQQAGIAVMNINVQNVASLGMEHIFAGESPQITQLKEQVVHQQ